MYLQSLVVDEETANYVIKHFKREGRNNPEAGRRMLINCAVQLPEKVPLYSLLIGTLYLVV